MPSKPTGTQLSLLEAMCFRHAELKMAALDLAVDIDYPILDRTISSMRTKGLIQIYGGIWWRVTKRGNAEVDAWHERGKKWRSE